MEYTITLTEQEMALIMRGIAKLPLEEVILLNNKLFAELEKQQKEFLNPTKLDTKVEE